jgi:hypothetical protein
MVWKLIDELLRTQRHEKHANRSYGEKEASTQSFIVFKRKGPYAWFILIEQNHVNIY